MSQNGGHNPQPKWATPQPLDNKLPPVAPFEPELLPPFARRWVADIAERMQVPNDYASVALMVALGGAISRRAVIRPKANDPTWVEVPNLYGAIVAPPGSLKSPVIDVVTKPLVRIEERWRNQYAQEMKKYEELSEEEQKQMGHPKLKRMILNDVTYEKVQEILSENLLGMIVVRDELAGLFASFSRNGHEGERQFYLTAWSGHSPYGVDRIGRGSIYLPACCLSVLGAIQPARLRDHLAYLAETDTINDGLIQRFQLATYPDFPLEWKYVDRKPDENAQLRVQHVFNEISKLEPEEPLVLRFSSDAQDLFIEWLGQLEFRIRSGNLDAALASHLAKYRGLMPSLAAIFSVAERFSRGFDGFGGRQKVSFLVSAPWETVSLENVLLAIRWCEYLETHAKRIYAIYSPEVEAAQTLAEHIKKGDVRKVFAARDIYQKRWRGLNEPEMVKAALTVLEKASWVRSLAAKAGPKGGRPSDRYQLSPRIWEVGKNTFPTEGHHAKKPPKPTKPHRRTKHAK
jgi:putative DNA primase/helicase